jgi:hypothetical protein
MGEREAGQRDKQEQVWTMAALREAESVEGRRRENEKIFVLKERSDRDQEELRAEQKD